MTETFNISFQYGWLYIYVTGFWKTDQIVTLGLFYFIGPTIGYTHTLHIHSRDATILQYIDTLQYLLQQ